jgi:hypothetical protein
MISSKIACGAAVLLLLMGCKPSIDESRPSANPTPGSVTMSSPTNASPATASHESPADTAASVAAAAPECKAIEQAQPGACQPSANGVPNTSAANK